MTRYQIHGDTSDSDSTFNYDAAAERLRGMFRDNFASNRFANFGIQEMI